MHPFITRCLGASMKMAPMCIVLFVQGSYLLFPGFRDEVVLPPEILDHLSPDRIIIFMNYWIRVR